MTHDERADRLLALLNLAFLILLFGMTAWHLSLRELGLALSHPRWLV